MKPNVSRNMIGYSKSKNYFSLSNQQYFIDVCFGNKQQILDHESFPFAKDDFFSIGQPHSNELLHLQKSSKSYENVASYDGVITDIVNVPLVIKTADCIPVLISNLNTASTEFSNDVLDEPSNEPLNEPFIVALHCGWRSVVTDLIGVTMAKIKNHYKEDYSKLKIFIGPAIAFENYLFQERGKQQVEQFLLKNNFDSNDYFYRNNFMDNFKDDDKQQDYFFDLKKLVICQLLSFGCLYQNIVNLQIDTYQDDNYNSHRRDCAKQRNYSIIQKRKI